MSTGGIGEDGEQESGLDLTSLLRPIEPPAGGAARARRTAGRRRLTRRAAAGGALAAAFVAGVVSVLAPGREPGRVTAPTTRVATAENEVLLVVSGLDEDEVAETVDLADGTVARTPHLVALAGSLARRGGLVIVPGATSRPQPVRVARPPYDGASHRIGTAWRVFPSMHDDRVWLVLDQTASRDGDANRDPSTRRIVEVDVHGRRTAGPVDVPCCRSLAGASTLGLVFTSGPDVELWEPSPPRLLRTFPAAVGAAERDGVVAVSGSRAMLAIDEGCESDPVTVAVLDLRTGQRDQLGDPCYGYPAGFSADGRWAVVRTPWDGAATSLVLFDPVRGPAVSVPGSTSAETIEAWGADGTIYFVDFDGAVRGYHPTTAAHTEVHRVTGGIVRSLVVMPPAPNRHEGRPGTR